MSQTFRYRTETHEQTLTITFDHPATRNALDRDTRQAFVELLDAADADSNVRAIVITGSGASFTSGVDAKQLLQDPDYVAPPVDPATKLRSLRTPTIAAVNGPCVSGGLEIALACSMIVAADTAIFADTHARLGLVPGWGLSAELPAAIGVRRARQMTLTATPIDATRALDWGLVNEVVPAAQLIARTGELATAIIALDAAAVTVAVELYRTGQDLGLDPARAAEREALQAWKVDRSAARAAFDQRVSPPST